MKELQASTKWPRQKQAVLPMRSATYCLLTEAKPDWRLRAVAAYESPKPHLASTADLVEL